MCIGNNGLCQYIYIYLYICISISISISISIYIYIYIYTYIYKYIYTYINIYIDIDIDIYTYIYICLWVCLYRKNSSYLDAVKSKTETNSAPCCFFGFWANCFLITCYFHENLVFFAEIKKALLGTCLAVLSISY